MIRYLRLNNFRRHADTELWFDDTDQLVLIGGRNGSGKTTLLEGISWVLYGEHRDGNARNLRKLIRRGAELEGMEVELEFDADDTTYRVKRRYDGKTTAVLYANDAPIVEGPREVTAEVARVLGMDARGFRLAVIAQQKELDGLARMRPAERGKELTRLLRLDSVTAARDAARARNRAATEIANGLTAAPGDSVADAERELADATTTRDAARTAAAAAKDRLIEIDAELAATGDVVVAYQEALRAIARAEERAAAAHDEVVRLEADLATLRIPPPVDAPDEPLDELAKTAADIERAIARGEAAERAAEHRAMVDGELTRARAQRAALDAKIDGHTIDALRADIDQLAATIADLDGSLAERKDARGALLDAHAAAKARAEDLARRLAETGELEGTCDRCGQDITDEHLHTQTARLEADLEAARAEITETVDAGKAVTAAIGELEAALDAARADRDAKARLVDVVTAALDERADVDRRIATYEAQLDRVVVDDVDMDELLARKSETAIKISLAQQASENAKVREAVGARKAALEDNIAAARARLDAGTAAVAAAAVDADLEAAHARREGQVEARKVEAELLAAVETQAAVAGERVDAAAERLERAKDAARKRARHQRDAMVASACAELLGDVSAHLAGRIQPALQGSISELLARLSEGRFSQVRVDRDYNIDVADDDGQFRPISEYSGGEADLIALATRLSLASVVADRHGSGGAGFLVLDEVFGSQDHGRREAILTALRNLRSTYGQILLTSHVGGLDGAADRVIDIAVGVDDDGNKVTELTEPAGDLDGDTDLLAAS